jgi:membrane-associated phospholipid phosphatase
LVAALIGQTVAPRSSPAFTEAEPDPVLERHYRPNQSPYRVNPALDIGLIVVGGAVAATPQLFAQETLRPWCGLDCDSNSINGLDRAALGQDSDRARAASDYLFFASMGVPFVFDAVDVAVSAPHDGWCGYGSDSLVLLETLALNFYLQNLVAFTVRRPRPYVYDDSVSDELRLHSSATLSFYSGHAASAFAGATAYSRLFMLRHPDSPLVIPVWATTYVLAAGASWLRVTAGEHFPTDVMVGAVAGMGIGYLIPWLHELPKDEGLSGSGKQARIRLRPWISGQGFGLSGTF